MRPSAQQYQQRLGEAFLSFRRDKALPLDFFSWHAYYGEPSSMANDATTARQLLDEFGFKNAESHLNEWRYLTTWEGLRPNTKNVPEWFARSTRAQGAAFCAAVLLTMQDRPVDVMNFYSADTSPWSIFGQFGIPTKTFTLLRRSINGWRCPTGLPLKARPTAESQWARPQARCFLDRELQVRATRRDRAA